MRSTEGQFPYWLGVDDRLIADEFFRGSYTYGVWVKGELTTTLKYNAMFANNLSTLGVSAAQLDNKFDTQSYSLQWLPTTGEFGLWGTFGDYDDHQKVATRVGVHFTHSLEEKQSQPGTEGIENSQIRLTDGSVIFTPDLFGPGITVNEVDYRMTSLDAGIKYKGLSLEGEYYRRWLSNFAGVNTGGIPDITDNGYQLQASAMVVPKVLQLYVGASQIFGDYGDPSEVRGGANWYPMKERGIRVNGEWMYVDSSPVGYTAYPYAGRRQGPRLPRQPRDELLIEGMTMIRRPRFRPTSLAPSSRRSCWRRGRDRALSARRRPAAQPPAAANELQRLALPPDQLRPGGHRRPRSSSRSWARASAARRCSASRCSSSGRYGNSGDFAPTYYLQTDAPLYYYSFTDAYIAIVVPLADAGGAGALRSDDHRLQPGRHVRASTTSAAC